MIRLFTKSAFNLSLIEFARLKMLPRFCFTETNLFSKKIRLVDSASFLSAHKEIFHKEIYKFKSDCCQPYIIDCGANIGLSIIYFKHLFPNANIIAFEPDPKISQILKHNMDILSLSSVHIIEKGVWNSETTLKFFSEGADGGRIAISKDLESIITIPTVRLRDYLDRDIDFLKIDIEGAETVVLEDCKDELHRVKNLFVEYHSFDCKQQKVQDVLRILSDAGFRYYIQDVGIFSQSPFIKRKLSNSMDMQLNIYACRT